tara:strand:- start:30 stop:215 length:186 start_codon:yes stop_codon:yes gene_type:complete
MTNLKVGNRIKFIEEGEVFIRKIHSIYVNRFNHNEIKYNTKGRNGGFGCDGFSVTKKQLID